MISATLSSTLSNLSKRISFFVKFRVVVSGSNVLAAFSAIALRPLAFSFLDIFDLIYSISSSTSRRGKIGVPFSTTLIPDGNAKKSNPLISIFSSGNPSCANIFFGACVITGWSKMAITRKLAARCAKTLSSSLAFDSSFANAHGSVSSMYLFVLETNFQSFSKATVKCACSSSDS